MGFSTLIDILGSIIIGGLLILTLTRMNEKSTQNTFDLNGESIVQSNLIEIASLLEYDLRKIGYCNNYKKQPDPTKAILQADSNSITFITDLPTKLNPYGDGGLDTVKYYLGSKTELSVTTNPNDRILYRKIGILSPLGASLGLTYFKLTFFDGSGNKLAYASIPATPPLGIIFIQADLQVENPNAYQEDPTKSAYTKEKRGIWRQIRLATRNFTRR